MKKYNFDIKNNLSTNNMDIVGGEITVKSGLNQSIYFKNILTLKKLNITFLDQILMLDGKYMLTFKEVFQKKINNFKLRRWSLLKASGEELENDIMENPNSNRKIKKNIFSRLNHKFQRFWIHKSSIDPLAKKTLVVWLKIS